jgi:predicted ferric reductase
MAGSMTDGPLLWFVNRGTGVVLLALLTLVTVLGVVARGRRAGGRLPGYVVPSLHRNLSVLCLALLGVHAGSAVVDEYVDIRWWQAFAPWAMSYRPWWLGIGTVASDLVLAAVLTSAIRRQLGYRVWRAVHWATYGAWLLGIVHGLGIGTDNREPWVLALSATCATYGAIAIAARAVRSWRRPATAVVAR